MRRLPATASCLSVLSLLLVGSCVAALAAQRSTRTLQDKPAVVIAAFGTSTKAQVTYDAFDQQLRAALPGIEIRWAFTSEIIRERVNARKAEQGDPARLSSLPQALADLEAQGYRKVAVQPLHVFPGEEYEEVVRAAERFPGLRIELGETLLHRWATVRQVIAILARDFLPPEEGCNVVVAHGSPTTAVGSNSTYLGLDRHLSRGYRNAFLGCVEGVVPAEDALEAAKAYPAPKVRFIPLLYVGGDHVMNDVMGEGGSKGGPSWKEQMTKAGKSVDAPLAQHEGTTYYKGLGLIPEVNEIFIREVQRALGRL